MLYHIYIFGEEFGAWSFQAAFLRCPMVDGGTCADEKIIQLLQNLMQELQSGRVPWTFPLDPRELTHADTNQRS